jgi:hypothetical protein
MAAAVRLNFPSCSAVVFFIISPRVVGKKKETNRIVRTPSSEDEILLSPVEIYWIILSNRTFCQAK